MVIVPRPRWRSPLWVKSGQPSSSNQCPLYPRKRTILQLQCPRCAKSGHMRCSKIPAIRSPRRRARVGKVGAGCFRCFQIDYQVVLSRRLYRQVGRFLAFEDTIYIARCAPIIGDLIRSVGDQTAEGYESKTRIDCRQMMLDCEPDDQIAIRRHRSMTADPPRSARHSAREQIPRCRAHLISVTHADRDQLNADGRCRGLNGRKAAGPSLYRRDHGRQRRVSCWATSL